MVGGYGGVRDQPGAHHQLDRAFTCVRWRSRVKNRCKKSAQSRVWSASLGEGGRQHSSLELPLPASSSIANPTASLQLGNPASQQGMESSALHQQTLPSACTRVGAGREGARPPSAQPGSCLGWGWVGTGTGVVSRAAAPTLSERPELVKKVIQANPPVYLQFLKHLLVVFTTVTPRRITVHGQWHLDSLCLVLCRQNPSSGSREVSWTSSSHFQPYWFLSPQKLRSWDTLQIPVTNNFSFVTGTPA